MPRVLRHLQLIPRLVAPLAMVSTLAGCGTYVPPLQEYFETASPDAVFSAGGQFEYAIKTKIYCDIVEAVVASREAGVLPTGWAVQTTLDLQVDESGSLNPGATYIDSPTFSIGAGAVLSSQATKESKFGSYWNLDKLKGAGSSPCANGRPVGSSAAERVGDSPVAEGLAEKSVFPALVRGEEGRPVLQAGLSIPTREVHRHLERKRHARLEAGARHHG
ncbi:hypothetical protein AB7M43_009542 [Bradyrhizobium elkanii]